MARKILLIDDNLTNRFLTQTILQKLGYEVDVLADGRGAADAVATGGFEAIFMDCQMPHVDGFEATAEIRRREAEGHGTRTPIIGVSARTMSGDEELAITKGMDAYVTKPVNVSKVEAALEQVLGRRD